MLNTRSCMREGTNERRYATTKHITTLLLRSRVKIKRRVVFEKIFLEAYLTSVPGIETQLTLISQTQNKNI